MTIRIVNGKILRDAEATSLVEGELLLREGVIVSVGAPTEVDADHTLDAEGGVVMPGLIQSHIHLCQTPLLGSAGDVPLMRWLRERTWPLEACHTETTLYDSVLWGAKLLIESGTTAVMDHATVRHTDAAFEALLASGLRGQSGKVLMDHPENCPAGLQDDTDSAVAESVELINRWDGAGQGRLRYSLNPRFVLSCTEPLLRETARLAGSTGCRVHTHAHEEPVSIDIVKRERGVRPIPHLDELGLLGPHTVLAHCVHLTDSERRTLADSGTHVCHCPSANLLLGSGVAGVPELLSTGVNVGLGTDAAAFNSTLNGWQEMRDAVASQCGRLGPGALTPREALKCATVGGAKALGLATELGVVEVGRQADLIVVETSPSVYAETEVEGLLHALVFDPGSVRVRASLVAGRVLMEGGVLRTVDGAEIERRGRRAQRELLRRMGQESTARTPLNPSSTGAR